MMDSRDHLAQVLGRYELVSCDKPMIQHQQDKGNIEYLQNRNIATMNSPLPRICRFVR